MAARSSTTASMIRSQSARSSASVVTFSREGSPSSTLAHSECACSSACQAEASERASSIVFEIALAEAASPQAIVPLPAIPVLS